MRRRMTALLGLAGFLGLQATGYGQTTFSWTNSGGGSYHTAGNWSPAGGPPGSDDIAQFNLAGSHTISFSQNGSESAAFRIRQGIVNFTASNGTANHTWGDGSTANIISPQAGDVATTATLILRDSAQTMSGWGELTIGTGTGKTGIMEVRNAHWFGYDVTRIGGLTSGTGELRIGNGGSFVSEVMYVRNGLVTVGSSGTNSSLTAVNLYVGGLGGVGELNVTASNSVNVYVDFTVSGSAGNSAFVVGPGATLEAGGDITVGTAGFLSGGQGLLSVQAGASVLGEDNLHIGYSPSAPSDTIEGNLVVTGTNGLTPSTVTINGSTIIGEGSKGSAMILQGGRFNGNALTVGYNSNLQSEFRVADAGSLANLTTVSVGQNGNGLLQILNGGRLNAQSAVIGSASGDATLNVSGTNALLFVSENMTLGDSNSDAVATIQNGGRVTMLDSVTIGNAAGRANVTISSAGRLEADNITIGTGSNSVGTLTVQGVNSRVNMTSSAGNTYVGRLGGTGTLNISNNAIFGDLDASIRIGSGIGSNNVGATGTLNASSGATIQARDLNVGEFTGTGHVSLTGSTTSIEVAEYLWLGFNFLSPSSVVRGTVDIDDSALLRAGNLILGSSSQDNRITIRNGGRLIVTGTTEIGYQRGTMVIESGGRFLSNGGIIASRDDDFYSGLGAVSVSGTSSSWSATGTNALDVGKAGIGSLAIHNGGSVQATNATIGGYDGGIGNVTLTGNSSTFSVGGSLSIGGTSTAQGGNGTLNVNLGTSVPVAGTVNLWSTGTINMNGGTLTMAAFNSQSGLFNWNAGTVSFSQNTTLTNNLLNSLVGTGHTLGQNRTIATTTGTPLTLDSHLTVDGGRVSSGGALTLNSGSTLVVNGGETTSTGVVTNNGSIVMNGPAATMNGGTIDNRGSIRGTGVINNTLSNNTTGQVRVAPGDWLTFNGSGHVNLGSVQMLGGVLEFAQFLNTGTQGFISGHGTLLTSSASQGGLGLVNTGTFAFSGGNTNIYGDVQNNAGGRIVTSGGSVTTFHDDVLHNGVEIRTSPGAYTIFFGSVSGASPYTGLGLVQFEGDLRPGNSPANVNFAGDVAFSVTAQLMMELGGLTAGSQYDRLTVHGQVILNGQLDVQLINGYMPHASAAFMIIDNQGTSPVLGTFAGLTEGTSFVSGGQLWEITYQGGTGNDVMLIAVPEPTTWALIGISTLGIAGYYGYRRRNDVQAAEQEISC